MFHIDCPRFRGFMTWDDLGCLARAVGFPTDLFKTNVTKHVTTEDHGMSVQQVNKMLDLRLLQQSIHRTRNLHTGEWNTKVIRKALYLMDHHALTFEELYNIRIAYKAFEGNDMRGMMLEERTMLSALKMCGRSIAPLKMMHRIKHMAVDFEEPDRMQLFEFLDLVLWADLYEEFTFKSMERAEGKEGDLFKLVDFDRLLSHHDKKLADRLNNEYLQEEWDFGLEKLEADKSKFKEPPVICGQSRIQMAREQKLKYRYLKSELGKSHRKMYRAKAGYIRDRPVTAPDLSMYEEQEAAPPPAEFTAQTAYEIVQRKVKSANAAVGRTQPDLSDKPSIPSPKKIWSPKVVSDAELEETQKNYDQLKFDIETLQGRFDYHKNKEIEYYFPGQLERLTKQIEEKEENETVDMMKKTSSQPSKPKITQKEVDRLAYPPSRIPPSHAKVCDARFRGWHNIKNKKGSHFVLVAPSFDNSYTGRLHKKLVETSNIPVKKIKGDFVHRYTKKTDVAQPVDQAMRPNTAPANLQSGDVDIEDEAVVSMTESPADSCKTVDTGYGSMEDKLGEGSSAESLEKSADHKTNKTRDELSPSHEPKKSFPKPFEKRKTRINDSENSDNVKMQEKKLIIDLTDSEKSKISFNTGRPRTSHVEKMKTSPGLRDFDRPKTSAGLKTSNEHLFKPKEDADQKMNLQSSSNRVDNTNSLTATKNRQMKNGFHKNVLMNTTSHNTDNSENTINEQNVSNLNEDVDINLKIENYKKDLNKYTLEKRAANNRRKVKSPPALEFTFTSVLNSASENDNLDDFTSIELKPSSSAWFDDDISSPDILSPRMPEPTIYTMVKKPKDKIDIENLPVPHLEHSKPKMVSVGAIGKISLLESITESTFWEDMIEETYRSSKVDEAFVEEDMNVNSKENELADLKDDDEFDDTVSNDSGCVNTVKVKPKVIKRRKSKGVYNINDKLIKAKEERLKRQKRVLNRSNFEKMGITVVKSPSNKGCKTSSSSESLIKDQDSSKNEQISSKSSLNSNVKQKNDKVRDQNKINIEITNEKQNGGNTGHNNSKIEEKQKTFCLSMKRLVKRMEGSMSTDLRSKMLATRLS